MRSARGRFARRGLRERIEQQRPITALPSILLRLEAWNRPFDGLTINPREIKFFLIGSASLLPHYLDLIESAIPEANATAATERQRLAEAVAEAERELRDRDGDIERALKSWSEGQQSR